AAKKEGGSAVRRTEESDRAAALAAAETQIRARAVLPSRRSPEHQATGKVPQPRPTVNPARDHIVELSARRSRTIGALERTKEYFPDALFQHPRDLSTTIPVRATGS